MKITSVLCGLSVTLGAACDHPTRSAGVDTVSIGCGASMTVSPATATLAVGDTLRALAAVSTCGTPLSVQNAPIFWRSSNPVMAAADSVGGLIHAHAPGDVSIIAASAADSTIKGAMALHVTP